MLLATRLTVAYVCVLALARITPSQAQLPCDQSKLSTHPFQPKDVTLGISGTTMTAAEIISKVSAGYQYPFRRRCRSFDSFFFSLFFSVNSLCLLLFNNFFFDFSLYYY